MATQREDGRWMAYARTGPKWTDRKARYGKTAEEADRKAAELEASLKELDSPPHPPTWPVGSFAEFVYGVWMPRVYPGLRATSIRSYDSMLRLHVLPALAYQKIGAIGYADLKAALDGMERHDGKGALPDRRKYECAMRIKEILSLYATMESAKGVPARTDWRLVKPPKLKRKKARPEPPADFTLKIMAACDGRFAWAKGPTFCALFLGMRRGEIAGLMWSDIDRESMTIRVSEQRQPEHKHGRVPTKGDERTIPIPDSLMAWLDKLGNRESVFVFTGAKGTPVPVDELSKVTPRLCEAAGLPRTTFHDQRSYAASNLVDMGVDLPLVAEILGHTEIDTTLIYVNRNKKAKRIALEQLLDRWTG